MKILHTVESYLPVVNGMQEVVKQISEYLVSKGHKVFIATSWHENRSSIQLINNVTVCSFKIKGSSVAGIKGDPSEIKRYQDFFVEEKFDVIVNFAAQQWATDLCLPFLSRVNAKKIFVPTGFSMLYSKEFSWYYDAMPGWLDLYDKVVYLSRNYRDINFSKQYSKTNGVVIPNGASKEQFSVDKSIDLRQYYHLSQNSIVFLTVGGHTGFKGHLEAIKIVDKLKLKNVVLVILGEKLVRPLKTFNILRDAKNIVKKIVSVFGLYKAPPSLCPECCQNVDKTFNNKITWRLNKKKVIVDSLSRELVVSFFKSADWFILPSQIECSPIVVYEALAAGLPFFSTDVGNCAEIATDSKAGFILPTKIIDGFSYVEIQESAKYIKSIVSNIDRKIISNKAKEYWLNGHTWEQIGEEYEKIYSS